MVTWRRVLLHNSSICNHGPRHTLNTRHYVQHISALLLHAEKKGFVSRLNKHATTCNFIFMLTKNWETFGPIFWCQELNQSLLKTNSFRKYRTDLHISINSPIGPQACICRAGLVKVNYTIRLKQYRTFR